MTKLIASFYLLLVSAVAFYNPKPVAKDLSTAPMPMCATMAEEEEPSANTILSNPADLSAYQASTAGLEMDSSKIYSMPLLSKTPNSEILLSWTEKDAKGMVSLCMALSKDLGKSFSDKKIIYTGTGIGNSRLMRAKVLAKKDGTFVAVFSNRGTAPAASNPPKRGGRSSDIVFCTSKDGGATWTSPESVDSDKTTGIVRGFFDAALMANDEVAVAYLKDVANSTKHEERDLRMVITKNGVFQPERVIDPVVCDCCNISLLLDANGALNVYYRDNNDDIRDIARMTSTDNAETFSKPQILHDDQWKINGCPHSGPSSVTMGKSALITWFSGAETEPGIRLVTNEGKKLLVLADPTAKNPFLLGSNQTSVLLWEQIQGEVPQLAYRKIKNNTVSETSWIQDSANGSNPCGLVVSNQLLLAYEVKLSGGKTQLKVSTVGM
jgi:hypothetical protein